MSYERPKSVDRPAVQGINIQEDEDSWKLLTHNNSEEELYEDNATSISEAYGSWALFRNSPRELWILLTLKLFESFAFISEDFVFLLYLREEPSFGGLTEFQAGVLYSLTAALTFIYGMLFSGYLIDTAGVRCSLIAGGFLLTLARLAVAVATSQ